MFHKLCYLSFYSQYVTSNFINPLSNWTWLTHNRWNCSNPRQRYVSLNNTGFKHWLEDRRPQKPLLTRHKARQDMAQHVMVEKSKPALYFNFLELNIQPDYIMQFEPYYGTGSWILTYKGIYQIFNCCCRLDTQVINKNLTHSSFF